MIRISKYQPMFSPIIQQSLNCIWLFQILLAVYGCIRKGYWVPSFISHRIVRMSILEKQFHSVLWAHFAFYIAELGYTELWKRERTMAYHHLSSLILLPLSSWHLGSMISVLYLTPFALHSWYWCFEDPPYSIVWAYNIALGVVCMYTLRKAYRRKENWTLRTTLRDPITIPITGILIGCCNASTFISRWMMEREVESI
jgi:hypothetical protein